MAGPWDLFPNYQAAGTRIGEIYGQAQLQNAKTFSAGLTDILQALATLAARKRQSEIAQGFFDTVGGDVRPVTDVGQLSRGNADTVEDRQVPVGPLPKVTMGTQRSLIPFSQQINPQRVLAAFASGDRDEQQAASRVMDALTRQAQINKLLHPLATNPWEGAQQRSGGDPEKAMQYYTDLVNARKTPDPVETGKTKREGGIILKEVQDVDAVTRKPIPGTAPRFIPWQQETATTSTTNDPANYNLSGEPFLITVPEKYQLIVKKLAANELDPKLFTARASNERNLLIRYASHYDPSWDSIDYPARAASYKFYTSGPGSTRVGQLNTVAGHITQLDKAVDALNNGNIKALNQIANAYKVQTGTSAPVVFNTIKNAVSGELAGLYKAGAGQASPTDPEMAEVAKTMDNSLSGNITKDVIRANVKLIQSRMETEAQRYLAGTKRKDFYEKFLTPKARDFYTRYFGRTPTSDNQESSGSNVGGDVEDFQNWLKNRK